MKRVLWLAVALFFMFCGQAFADYSFSIQTPDGLKYGTLTTSSDGPGPLLVIGGSLDMGGSLGIASLYNDGNSLPDGWQNLSPAGATYYRNLSPAGAYWYNNLIYPGSAQMIDINGLLFTIGTKGDTNYTEINIWGNSLDPNNYSFSEWTNTILNYSTYDLRGTFTSAPVPIPSAVWMFGAGLIALIGARRRLLV